MADADFPALRGGAKSFASFAGIGGTTLPARLHSAVAAIDGTIVLTTSFGMEAQLIAHHIFTERLPIEVVTLDTGRLFPETYNVWQATEERYGTRIRAYYPEADAVRAMVADSGINGFYYSKDARIGCCEVRKVGPLKRALAGAVAWMVGLRADQSRQRSSVRLTDWDVRRGLVKLAPLFDWTREAVAAECQRLGVPVNALYAQGYPSIGCEPCTRAVEPGEEERAGRWWWERDDTKECGLHMPSAERPIRTKAA
jgi:phosphoadenosine phosphosulfate reductase